MCFALLQDRHLYSHVRFAASSLQTVYKRSVFPEAPGLIGDCLLMLSLIFWSQWRKRGNPKSFELYKLKRMSIVEILEIVVSLCVSTKWQCKALPVIFVAFSFTSFQCNGFDVQCLLYGLGLPREATCRTLGRLLIRSGRALFGRF